MLLGRVRSGCAAGGTCGSGTRRRTGTRRAPATARPGPTPSHHRATAARRPRSDGIRGATASPPRPLRPAFAAGAAYRAATRLPGGHRVRRFGSGAVRGRPVAQPPAASPRARAAPPRYAAAGPSSSSMRSSWLYFATRSLRAGAPVLIWPAVGRDREVGDGRVLGLAAAVRHHRRVAVAGAPARRLSSVSVSVPIWLTLIRIEFATPRVDALLQPLRVGDEQVVADELHLRAERSVQRRQPSQSSSAMPSSIETIGYRVAEAARAGRTTRRAGTTCPRPRARSGRRVKNSLAAGSSAIAISSPGRVAGRLDRVDEQLDRLLVRRQVRARSRLRRRARSRGRGRAAACARRVVRLRAPAQRLAEARGADGREHELLEVDVAVGVRAAVEHVHHRHRQHVRVRAADVAVQRQVALVGARPWPPRATRRGCALAPRRPLLAVPSSSTERVVEQALVERLHPGDRVGDLAVDVARRPCGRPCRRSGRRRRAARPPRGRRCWRRSGPRPGPARPLASSTSTSTVGLPRESRISRACTPTISLTAPPRVSGSKCPAVTPGCRPGPGLAVTAVAGVAGVPTVAPHPPAG